MCPFVLSAKTIFQDECKSGKQWDNPLSPKTRDGGVGGLEELPLLSQFKVECCLLPVELKKPVKFELRYFGDASLSAFGSASYLHAVNPEGKIHCSLLLEKSRLTPIRQMMITRLATKFAVIMDRLLSRELTLEIQLSIFWTDSMIVLQYR